MRAHELVGCALCFIGGFGGLANALAYTSMIDSLNTLRPPEDQIPIAYITWNDWKHASRRNSYWAIAREFHSHFPHDRRYLWLILSPIWMLSFFLAGFLSLFLR